jgi:hypothetical protein
VPLRPLGLSDILDGSFPMIRRNPKLTLGLSAGVAAVQLLIMLAVEILTNRAFGGVYVTGSADPSASTSLGPLLGGEAAQVLQLVVTTLLGALLTGMLTVAITQDVLGVRLTLAQAWARVRPRMWRLLILAIVTTVAEFAGLILLIAPGVWLWGVWAVAVPALMVEGTTMRGALRRSRELVHGTFWRVWGIRALGVLIVQVLAAIIVIPFVIAGAVVDAGSLSSGTDRLPLLFAALTALGSAVAAAFTAPVRAGIDALLYVDLRMRKEGLDIVLQQQLAATTPAPAPPPPRTAF